MSLLKKIKKNLYFFVATYFGFFALIVLRRSKPTVITVTGSSGKTTLLHLLEAQLGDRAEFSHKANSAFGLPFHILGLERKTFSFSEWPVLILRAPFKVFRKLPKKIYVAEADAERPGEGRFLARLVKPDVLIWLSLEEAHGVNYDSRVSDYSFENLKKVIAGEFGEFLSKTKKLAVLNSDNEYIVAESVRTKAKKIWLGNSDVTSFEPKKGSVVFETSSGRISLPNLVPQVAGSSALAVKKVMEFLNLPFDPEFKNFYLPPSRSSVFAGKKDTTLIDSTYNATFDGVRAMLNLFNLYPSAGEKWLVLGDMIEEGKSEEHEHTELAAMIESVGPSRVVLVGPRLQKFTLPKLKQGLLGEKVISFLYPDEATNYLEKELKGGEAILFKGARFLEGVVESLLADSKDAAKLCRREPIWQKRRATLKSTKN